MDGWIEIGTKIDTKQFDAQVEYIEHRMEVIEATLSGGDVAKSDARQLRAEYEKLGNQLVDIKRKQNDISSGGNGITDTIKKVSKWGLAIFGVRSAYLGIRQAMGYVSQYNEDMANKIESIKFSLASAIEPIISKIVNLVYVLLQYVQYIIKAWTGKDIFASAKKNLTGANKQAKELKKTMAGFDTAQVLSDPNSNSASTGASTPPALSELGEGDAPEWLKWIAEHGTEVALVIGSITAAILVLKITLNPIAALVTLLVGTILAIIISNWDKIKEVTAKLWENIKKIFSKVGEFFGNAFKAAFNAIKAVFNGITSFFSGIWSKIKSIFSAVGSAVGNAFKSAFVTVINTVLKTAENVLNLPIKAINKLLDVINKVPGIEIGKLSTLKLPRLASGGIVNNPGRGVPIGGAIAGEAGREGVLPLTDSQAMAQLGAEIGKWISVNVDLTTKLDSRVLSRSLERVQQNNSFTRNGV